MVARHFTDGEIWRTLEASQLFSARVTRKGEEHTRRLYANEMVDKPYTRFGITDDAQNHIVPTLIRQTR